MRLDIKYIFDDYEGRAEGLQGKILPGDACALFVYDVACSPKFHMRDVPTDLYLSTVVDGECVASAFMPKGSKDVFPAGRTRFVIESRVEVPVGSRIEIDGWELVAE